MKLRAHVAIWLLVGTGCARTCAHPPAPVVWDDEKCAAIGGELDGLGTGCLIPPVSYPTDTNDCSPSGEPPCDPCWFASERGAAVDPACTTTTTEAGE